MTACTGCISEFLLRLFEQFFDLVEDIGHVPLIAAVDDIVLIIQKTSFTVVDPTSIPNLIYPFSFLKFKLFFIYMQLTCFSKLNVYYIL